MKTRKHRIFIINKNNINLQPNNQFISQGNNNPAGSRILSKRKNLFKDMVPSRPLAQKHNRPQYLYQVKPHIHAQSLARIIKCDLLGSSQPQEKQQQSKPSEQHTKLLSDNQLSKEQIKNIQANQQSSKNHETHNRSFANNLRKRIFENNNMEQVKVRCSSTLSCKIKRKNMFFRYTSPNDISINSSASRERRRIFSHNANVLPSFTPNSHQKIAPLQSTIKQQQQKDISKISQAMRQSKNIKQSLHRIY